MNTYIYTLLIYIYIYIMYIYIYLPARALLLRLERSDVGKAAQRILRSILKSQCPGILVYFPYRVAIEDFSEQISRSLVTNMPSYIHTHACINIYIHKQMYTCLGHKHAISEHRIQKLHAPGLPRCSAAPHARRVTVGHELVQGVTHGLRGRKEVDDERTDSAARSVVVKDVCVRRCHKSHVHVHLG